MVKIEDKLITVEALSALNTHDKETFMTKLNPTGSGTMTFDGDINAKSLNVSEDLEISGNRLYYKIGDTIDVRVRTSGYVTEMGTKVFFTIPLTKPIIGEPMLEIRSDKGFILRQGGKYTHGSDGATTPSATYVHPINYQIDNNFNSGIVVTAIFEDTTNAINNDTIGIYFDATIVLIDPNTMQ